MSLSDKIPAIKRIKNRYNKSCIKATENYFKACRKNNSSVLWPVRIFSSLNLFLWHLEEFKKNKDPFPEYINQLKFHTKLINDASKKISFINNYNDKTEDSNYNSNFEKKVTGIFGDIWVDMTDDIYFDETYKFTCERLKKNNINPYSFFKDKIVVDAGCGSGKFSATIARLGAKKVYGIDIGKKGLEFAKLQAKKKEYGKKLKFIESSLLNISLKDKVADLVWSNGVIHHTSDYNKCLSEFNRILKKEGKLFLYVSGSSGLYELIQDTLRVCNEDVPRYLFQNYLKSLRINSGRLYWLMDSLYAPYEYKSYNDVEKLLINNGFDNLKQLTRGIKTDSIEQVTSKLPFADKKYGESQLKIICNKI